MGVIPQVGLVEISPRDQDISSLNTLTVDLGTKEHVALCKG